MYKRINKLPPLKEKELKKAVRKQINNYQLQKIDEITGGEDHWKWHGGNRMDFVVKILTRMVKAGACSVEQFDSLTRPNGVGPAVDAEIVDGRWIARCECGGAEVVDPQDPVMVCLNPACLNVFTKHKPRKVKFPSKPSQKAIAEILLTRPNPINRNWNPEETLEQIEAENVMRGLEKRTQVRDKHGVDDTNNKDNGRPDNGRNLEPGRSK